MQQKKEKSAKDLEENEEDVFFVEARGERRAFFLFILWKRLMFGRAGMVVELKQVRIRIGIIGTFN